MDVSGKTMLIHLLVMLFGAGAWIAVNGVWVELPVIVYQTPEQWNLPAYLTVISQVGNIGPIIVTIMQAFFSKYYNQNAMIYTILSIGTTSCLLLCFFWNGTAVIGGQERSLSLFILWFALAFVDCSSSVTFLPFMMIFPNNFLTTYFFGEGLSGLFPSIFSLAQGAGDSSCVNVTYFNSTTNTTSYKLEVRSADPRFSESVFFGLLFIMMALCSASFILLNHLPIAKKLYVSIPTSSDSQNAALQPGCSTGNTLDAGTYQSIELEDSSGSSDSSPNQKTEKEEQVPVAIEEHSRRTKLARDDYLFLLVVIFLVNSISNGILPSVSSYTSLPYGQTAYHLSTSLGNMANPLACFIAFFLPIKSYKAIGFFCLVAVGFASYLLVLAVGSPCPVLVNNSEGAALMVLSQILFVGFASYVKVSIAQVFRERGHKKSLVWYGAIVQAGSLTGAIIMFVLVNVYRMFVAGDPCYVCP